MKQIITLLVAAGMTLAAFAQTPSTVGVALQPSTSRVVGTGTNLFTANADRAVATIDTVARLATLTNAVHGAVVDVRGYATEFDLPSALRYTLNTNSAVGTNRIAIANAGGTGRWVHDWDGDVAAFGAIGDGTTDDGPALNAAFDFGPRNGIKLKSRPGAIHKVLGPLFATNSNTYFDGQGATIELNVIDDATTAASFRTMPLGGLTAYGYPQEVYATNSHFRNFRLVGGNLYNTGNTNKILMYLTGCDGCSVSDADFYGGTNAAWLLASDSSNVRLSNLYGRNEGALFRDGFHISSGTNIVMQNAIVYAGDDALPVGNEFDRLLSDVVIDGFYAESSHGFWSKVYTVGVTNPATGAAPTNKLQRITYSNGNAKNGKFRNSGIMIVDQSWAYVGTGITNLTPGWLISDIKYSNVNMVDEGTNKTVNTAAIQIFGGERIEFDNVDVFSPFWLTVLMGTARDISFRNCRLEAPRPSASATNATFQTLLTTSTAYGTITHTYERISFDSCQIFGRPDVTTSSIKPFNIDRLLFHNNDFYIGDNGPPALYFNTTTTNVSVCMNRFHGSTTNAAILFGGQPGTNNFFADNWFAPTIAAPFSGSTPKGVFSRQDGWESRLLAVNTNDVAQMDYRLNGLGMHISQATNASKAAQVNVPLFLEVEGLGNVQSWRRASTLSQLDLSFPSGRPRWLGGNGQWVIADNNTANAQHQFNLLVPPWDGGATNHRVLHADVLGGGVTANMGGGSVNFLPITTWNFFTGISNVPVGTVRFIIQQQGDVNFVPLAVDPSSASQGDFYYNSTEGTFKAAYGTSTATFRPLNGIRGLATLTGGTVTITNAYFNATTLVQATYRGTSLGGVSGTLFANAGANTLTINSTSGTDTNQLDWFAFTP